MNDEHAGLTDAPPPRVLGPVDATCIVIGAIIGVGIFFNPSEVAGICGSASLALLAWALAGFIALCGALVFAELGGMYHASGAHYEVLRDSYGSMPAFLFVFCNITVIQPGSMAVIGLICGQHLLKAVGAPAALLETQHAAPFAIAVALMVMLALANVIGVRWGARIQNLTVYAKLLTLLAVTGLAMWFAAEAPAPAAQRLASAPSGAIDVTKAMMAALIPAFFAYGGWQQVLWIAGEVREPRRNLPRSIIAGVLIVIAAYLLVNWAYLALLGVGGVASTQTLAADAVGVAWPDVGERIVALAVAISAFGVLNTQLLTGPRLIFGMARDSRFFPVFATTHQRFRTPAPAIALLVSLALLMLYLGWTSERAISTLTAGVVQVDAVFFALTGAALIVLRYRRANADRPMRVPLYPVVPALFVLGEVGAIAGSYMDDEMRGAAVIGGAWIAIGAVVYWVRFRTR